jgi:hypothetical protein
MLVEAHRPRHGDRSVRVATVRVLEATATDGGLVHPVAELFTRTLARKLKHRMDGDAVVRRSWLLRKELARLRTCALVAPRVATGHLDAERVPRIRRRRCVCHERFSRIVTARPDQERHRSDSHPPIVTSGGDSRKGPALELWLGRRTRCRSRRRSDRWCHCWCHNRGLRWPVRLALAELAERRDLLRARVLDRHDDRERSDANGADQKKQNAVECVGRDSRSEQRESEQQPANPDQHQHRVEGISHLAIVAIGARG